VPGALLRNRSLRFVCREVAIVAQRPDSPFTVAVPPGAVLRMPVAHGEGCYYADDRALDGLEAAGQVLFRYAHPDGTLATAPADPANPNGSARGIAGVANAAGNVAGLMPHPERAAEALLGSDDGMWILRSLVQSAAQNTARRPAEPAPLRPGATPTGVAR
jgi:phosphoribosylformylglycinamidine synthase subunit PurQ / glutaminase